MSGGITDELARAKNKAWRVFHFWLQGRHRADLERVATDAQREALATKYPPLDTGEIGDAIRMRLITARKCEAEGRPLPPIL